MTQSTPPGATDPPKGVLLYKGAEADVIRADWCGLDAVYKVRRRLPYRLAVLDAEIRRQRTIHEAQMLSSAKKAGVATPYLYFVDPNGSTLVMEYVAGDRMKDLVSEVPAGESAELFERLGADAARLHSAGLMHGDLTTANVVKRGDRLVFIDFGLAVHSSRVEDYAVDLRLIKETIVGAHPGISERALGSLFKGYTKVAGTRRARAVLRQLRAIERRGRYARVE